MPNDVPHADERWDISRALQEAANHFRADRFDQAEQLARSVLTQAPYTAGALQLLGLIEFRREHPKRAAELLREALALRPNEAEFHANLAIILQAAGQSDAALEHFRRAIDLKPDYVEAHRNLGIALSTLGDFEGAIHAFRTALIFRSDHAETHYNLGRAFQKLNRSPEALDAYRQTLQLKPDHDEARLGVAWVQLLTGEYPDGWRDYEGRFQTRVGQKWGGHRTFPQPLWQGEPLDGRTLLVHCEQGLGDTIQFCRYVSLLKDYGGRASDFLADFR